MRSRTRCPESSFEASSCLLVPECSAATRKRAVTLGCKIIIHIDCFYMTVRVPVLVQDLRCCSMEAATAIIGGLAKHHVKCDLDRSKHTFSSVRQWPNRSVCTANPSERIPAVLTSDASDELMQARHPSAHQPLRVRVLSGNRSRHMPVTLAPISHHLPRAALQELLCAPAAGRTCSG